MNWKWGIFIGGCTAAVSLVGLLAALSFAMLAFQLGRIAPSIVTGVQVMKDVNDRIHPAFDKWDKTNQRIEDGVKALKDFRLFREEEERRRR